MNKMHDQNSQDARYAGIAQLDPNKDIPTLPRMCSESEIMIRPDGILYAPVGLYRDELNAVFGIGNWGLRIDDISVDALFADDDDVASDAKWKEYNVTVRASLFINGHYVSEAVGDQRFGNPRGMGYADAIESARSTALTRCCKDIGLFADLHNKHVINALRDKLCVEVWVSHQEIPTKKRKLWRMRIDPPINQFPWIENAGQTQSAPRAAQPKPAVAYVQQQHDSAAAAQAQTSTNETPAVDWRNTVITFGKYKNQSFADIAKFDPDYFLWLRDKYAPKTNPDGSYMYANDANIVAAVKAWDAEINNPIAKQAAPKVTPEVAELLDLAEVENDLPF